MDKKHWHRDLQGLWVAGMALREQLGTGMVLSSVRIYSFCLKFDLEGSAYLGSPWCESTIGHLGGGENISQATGILGPPQG